MSDSRRVLSSWFSAPAPAPSPSPSYHDSSPSPSRDVVVEGNERKQRKYRERPRKSKAAENSTTPHQLDRKKKAFALNKKSQSDDDEEVEEGFTTVVQKKRDVFLRRNETAFAVKAEHFAKSPLRGGLRDGAGRSPKRYRRPRFMEHLSPAAVKKGLEDGTLLQGLLRVNHKRPSLAYVSVEGFDKDILIDGMVDRNRAFDGDTVIIKIHDKSKWEVVKEAKEELEETAEVDEAEALQAEWKPEAGNKEAVDGEESEGDVDDEEEDVLVTEKNASVDEESSEEEEIEIEVNGNELASSVNSRDNATAELPKPHERGWWKPNTEFVNQASTNCSIPGSPLPSPPAVTIPVAEKKPLNNEEEKEEGQVKLRRTAQIVAIQASNHIEEMVGYLKPCGLAEEELGRGNFMAFFVPLEKRVPRLLVPVKRLPASFLGNSGELTSNLFVARITEWPISSIFPKGDLIQNLGPAGDMEVEMQALLADNGIDWEDSFSQDCISCLPVIPPEPQKWEIPQEEVTRRRDLRQERIFTIDPLTAKDMDDAVSCKKLDDGTFLVGVHIADVTYFVQAGNALDQEARKRATTVYLVHRSIPMLPRLLSDNMCSLVPGEDRLAFSVMWKMDKEGKILEEPWFGRTIIRSCIKLAYEHAQQMLDGLVSSETEKREGSTEQTEVVLTVDPSSLHKLEEVVEDVTILNEMAKSMKQRRLENGSLTLDDSKMYFKLDENAMPISVGNYVRTESHFLIEEFMLQANQSVAIKIYSSFPNGSLLRRHPPPNDNKLTEFKLACTEYNIEFDSSSSGAFQASLKKLCSMYDEDTVTAVLRLAMKPMSLAKYTCTNEEDGETAYRHYALAFDFYTHFTSPIRRYSDVIVHRLLQASLEGKPCPVETEELMTICENCNNRKTKADKAQDKCDLVFLCTLLKNHPPMELDAIVLSIYGKSFDIYIPLYGVEKMIRVEDMPLTKFEYDKKQKMMQLVWPAVTSDQSSDSSQQEANSADGSVLPKEVVQNIKIFTRVKVRLYPDLQRKPIDVRAILVPPPSALIKDDYYPTVAPDSTSATTSKGDNKGFTPRRERGEHTNWRASGQARPEDQQIREGIDKQVRDFLNDSTKNELRFSADLSSFERLVIHQTAERYGLVSRTTNFTCQETNKRKKRIAVLKTVREPIALPAHMSPHQFPVQPHGSRRPRSRSYPFGSTVEQEKQQLQRPIPVTSKTPKPIKPKTFRNKYADAKDKSASPHRPAAAASPVGAGPSPSAASRDPNKKKSFMRRSKDGKARRKAAREPRDELFPNEAEEDTEDAEEEDQDEELPTKFHRNKRFQSRAKPPTNNNNNNNSNKAPSSSSSKKSYGSSSSNKFFLQKFVPASEN